MTTWRMSLGPAAIAIRTDLRLAGHAGQPAVRAASDLYQLEQVTAAGAEDISLDVELDDPGPAGMFVDPASGNVRLRAPRADLSADDLLFLAYLVLESRLHLHGILTLHSAAAERDGQAILLLGHSGAGKTTTAIRLCRDHGFGFLANDLVVVGGQETARIYAGTRNITLRQSSVAAVMPDLLSHFAEASADPWRAKIDVLPQDLAIPAGHLESEIELVVFVHSDPAYSTVLDVSGDSLAHRLNLHENALRYIRACSTPWMIGPRREYGHYVPSLDSAAAHEARTATLRRLMAMSRYIAGPPESVAGAIAGALRSPAAASRGGAL